MATFLFAWNPKKWKWKERELTEQVSKVAATGSAEDSWSCGNRKNLPVGSRFFLIRLGLEPKGIIGSGQTTSRPALRPHWDPALKRLGKKTLSVDINFDFLSKEPLITWNELQKSPYSTVPWGIQASGAVLPESIADELEQLWRRRTDAPTRNTVLCRICWNSEGWTHPTGEAARSETGSFVSKNGFGHEEWLMNIGWLIDGWHYGFLQPINSAFKKWGGRVLEVILYTIAPDKRRFYVGSIDDLHVITSSEADSAAREYRARGWFNEMTQQVKNVRGNIRRLEAPPQVHHLLNVRYRPDSLKLFVPFTPADDFLSRLPSRYRVYPHRKLIAKDTGKGAKKRAPIQLGKQALLPQLRKPFGTVIANPIEKIMQQEICQHLRKHYSNVEAERDFVDIKVETSDGITLIELKSSASALMAIRDALGQILQYAFAHPEWRSSLLELVIVGQGLPTEESKKYIEWLRHDYNLPVRYISYQRGGTAFQL